MVRFSQKRSLLVTAALVAGLGVGTLTGCGGGDTTAADATSAPTGTITSASTKAAPYAVTVTLSDGTTAVVGGYLPELGGGSTRVEAEVGDLVAFMLPPAFSGRVWKAEGGTASGAVAELAGSGTATGKGKADSDSFTYRMTAAGEGSLSFREEETAPGDGPPQPAFVARYTLVVAE